MLNFQEKQFTIILEYLGDNKLNSLSDTESSQAQGQEDVLQSQVNEGGGERERPSLLGP